MNPRDNGRRWDRFVIRVSRHPAAADARRVVFDLAAPAARDAAGRPAAVVLRAGGDLVVRFDPPDEAADGLTRDDYVRKAVEVVRTLPGC